MENNDSIKETISNLKAVRNNFWTAILLLSGGTVTLLLNNDSILESILIGIGILFLVIFISLYRNINCEINLHIKKLEEKEKR